MANALADDYGLSSALLGWELTEVTGISADGVTVVGNGINPDGNIEGWIAALSPVDAQPGDFDIDGDVDGDDFLTWQLGDSPAPLSAADLAEWDAYYGADSSSLAAARTEVPEPRLVVLAAGTAFCLGLFKVRPWPESVGAEPAHGAGIEWLRDDCHQRVGGHALTIKVADLGRAAEIQRCRLTSSALSAGVC